MHALIIQEKPEATVMRKLVRARVLVRADTEGESVGGFMEVARKLELPQKDARETDVVVEAVRAWFETHENWLLVLDNVEWDGRRWWGSLVYSLQPILHLSSFLLFPSTCGR